MLKIGLIREGKIPSDNRVALTPAQCKWIHRDHPGIRITVQQSDKRCFSDHEYQLAGMEVKEDMTDCDVLLGIKEVPVNMLIPGKTYLFFSHTKKLQPYNQGLLQAVIEKKITLIDYECLEHSDGTRIIGFGFFAGVVGAHNGIMAYGKRTGTFKLDRVNSSKNFQHLVHTYFGLKMPNIKIAVTGNGRVAHGVLEIMNLLDIHETEPTEYLEKEFEYPVYVHLKSAQLYRHKVRNDYSRDHFHQFPDEYNCLFSEYLPHTDILMNGVYWETRIPRLFENSYMQRQDFRIKTIADITDDEHGSVPCNLGDSVIEDPVYGVNCQTLTRTAPFLDGCVDVMAVGNLPNELPRDASRYFGEQLIKFVLAGLEDVNNETLDHATIIKKGALNEPYEYMREYAEKTKK